MADKKELTTLGGAVVADAWFHCAVYGRVPEYWVDYSTMLHKWAFGVKSINCRIERRSEDGVHNFEHKDAPATMEEYESQLKEDMHSACNDIARDEKDNLKDANVVLKFDRVLSFERRHIVFSCEKQ